jgi:ADP-heptose:LPS heptosyltransferase
MNARLTLFAALRMKIGIRLATFRFRKRTEQVISFARAISGAERALVIMPLDQRELLSAFNVIIMLKRKFDEERITVIGDERGVEAIRLMPKSHFIQIRETDINLLYHPRPAFLSLLKDRKFDLAIDLNLDLVLPSAYICRETNAKVRIGFAGAHADRFFNFQIQPDPQQSRKTIYDRVAKCLYMF